MRTLTTPIVGAHFRPPAKQLLEVLPIGTPMLLRAEPDNPYDENAIQVLVSLSKTYPISQWAVLAAALEGTGYTPQDLIDHAKQIVPRELTACERRRFFLPEKGDGGNCPS